MVKVYDFHRLKERFSYKEEDGLLVFHIPLQVEGETGKIFNLKGIVKGVKPPEGFEGIFMSVMQTSDGRGSSKYYQEAHRELNYILSRYQMTLPPLTFEGRQYIGVSRKRKSTSDWHYSYEPYFFNPQEMEMEPVIVEKNATQPTRHFYRIDGKYYVAAFDLLRDVSSGRSIKVQEELIDSLKKKIPVEDEKIKLDAIFPRFLVKGYAPVLYFGHELFFNEYYGNGREIVVTRVKPEHTFQSDRTGYATFNQFLYAYGDKYPECRDLLKIKDPALIGEELEEFPIGSAVVVSAPSDRHSSLQNVQGVVEKKSGDKVVIRFLDYFTETFSPKEINKAN